MQVYGEPQMRVRVRNAAAAAGGPVVLPIERSARTRVGSVQKNGSSQCRAQSLRVTGRGSDFVQTR